MYYIAPLLLKGISRHCTLPLHPNFLVALFHVLFHVLNTIGVGVGKVNPLPPK